MKQVDRKGLAARIEIKDADKGTFDALIASFMVVDKDGDVTYPGAFPEGKTIPVSSYGHTSWEGQLPTGIATLSSTRTEAVASGKFFLDTQHGADTWATLKAMQEAGTPSEWSYGYNATDYSYGEHEGQNVRFLKSVDVFEVSPVLRGAGEGTRTLDIKSARGKGSLSLPIGYRGGIPAHETSTVDSRWDPYEAVKTLGVAPSIADLRSVHAWFDPSADPERKSSYHFLHHGGPDEPANLRACVLGIAALNGAKGPQVPDDVKQEVYDHLASHLRDANHVVPDLKSGNGILKLRDQCMVVLADITALNGRIAEVGASRTRKNEHGLTGANRELLGWIADELRALESIVDTPDDNMVREHLRWIRIQNGL